MNEDNMKKSIWLKVLISLVLVLMLTGCSQGNTASSSNGQESTSTKKSSDNVVGQRIKVTINGKTLDAHLNDSSAAKAFEKHLPTTLNFSDFMDMPEKVADLHYSLPTKGMPSGHEGTKGYIGYWSPDKRIVFYYGTEDYYDGIHIIGKFDDSSYQNVVKNMGNNVSVQIQKAN